jgi:DNA-binding GntR family transcriptional regulator
VLSWNAVPATPEIGQLLDLSANAEVLCIESLDIVDSNIIAVCSRFCSAAVQVVIEPD